MVDSAPQTNKTTKTSFRVIESLAGQSGCRVTELSRRLEMPKSTVYKHLSTLREIGYVVKDGEEYVLSAKFVELGNRTRQDNPFYRDRRADVAKLVEITGDVVGLFLEENGRGIDLYQQRGTYAHKNDVGFSNAPSLHASAAGKAILAQFSDDRVDEILDRYGLPQLTPNTITDRAELFDQLDSIRDRGVAHEFEEQQEGYNSIAMGIARSDSADVGSIYVVGPTDRMATQRMEQDLERALESTRPDTER